MKNFNFSLFIAASAIVFFTACSDDSSSGSASSGAPTGPSTDDIASGIVGTITQGECAAADASTEAKIQTATEDLISAFQALDRGDFNEMQQASAEVKATFKSVIDAYPNHCGAQLGYAVSVVADIVNNNAVKTLINSVNEDDDEGFEYASIMNLNVETISPLLYKTATAANAPEQKVITDQIQEAAATVIPSLDSAIVYLRNVSSVESYSFEFTFDDTRLSLDKSEFSPTIAALHLAKAFLTAVASINIKLDENGSYDWLYLATADIGINETMSSERVRALNKMTDLFSTNSPFTTIYSEWKNAWKNIPTLIDSALVNVIDGLKFSVAESQIPGSQDYDLYVVGDGEEADVSPADLQMAIDTLELYRSKIFGAMDISINGVPLKLNLSKFFDITDGFQDYLPYFKFTEPTTWSKIPESEFAWNAEVDYGALIWTNIAEQLAPKMNFPSNSAGLDIYVYHYRSSGTFEIEFEYEYPNYDYASADITLDGCNFTASVNYIYAENVDFDSEQNLTGTIDTRYCKNENGTVVYAHRDENSYFEPEQIFFTDKNGKMTLSLNALYRIESDFEYREALKKNVIFRDPTFNGILPGQTNESLWQLIFDLEDAD